MSIKTNRARSTKGASTIARVRRDIAEREAELATEKEASERRELIAGLQSALATRVRGILSGRNVTALSRRLGISRTALYEWAAGKATPDAVAISRLAAETGYSAAWLATGEGPVKPGSPLADDYFFPDLEPLPREASPLAFKSSFLFRICTDAKLIAEGTWRPFLIEMVDDSMEPTIKRGDLLLVSRKKGLESGGLFAFERGSGKDHQIVVRRVQLQMGDERIVVSCDNRNYPSETLTFEQFRELWSGGVFWRGGRI